MIGSLRRFAILLVALTLFASPGMAQDEEVAVAPPSLVVGDPAGPPLSGEQLDTRTEEVAALVRCPVCQGLSVNDSPAPMAVKMKKQVRNLLSQGYTEKQILSYFERSYGEFVLLEPPLRGINWLVWLAPVILLAIGIAIMVWLFRRSTPAPLSDESEETVVEEETDPYILEVRRLAYGDSEESSR